MNSVLITSVLLSAALMLGRISGLIRETLLANRLGASADADSAILLLTLPDFMVGLLLAGGFSAALVPALKSLDSRLRIILMRRISLIVVLGFIVLSFIFFLLSENIIRVFIPKVDFDAQPDFLVGFRISLVALPIAALVGVCASYLNTVGRFSLPSLSVLVFNASICTFLALPFYDPRSQVSFAFVVVFSSLLRLLFQFIGMPEIFRRHSSGSVLLPKDLGSKFFFGVLGYSVIVGSAIVFRSLYALNGDGFMATYNYGIKLFELPATILIAPVAIVLLPTLSAVHLNENDKFQDSALKGLLAALTLACVATCVGWLYMPTFVGIIFEHGAVTPDEAERITSVARVLILALPAYSLLQICATVLNAQGKPGLLLRFNFIGLVVGLLSYFFLFSISLKMVAAPAGFLVFNLVSTIFCIGAIFGWRFPGKAVSSSIAIMALKIAIISFPFVYANNAYPEMSMWLTIFLISLLSVFSTLANINLVRPLLSMRVNKS